MSYKEIYQQSIEQPEDFWRDKAQALPWFKFPQTILSKDDNGIDRWFADGEMNTAYMALDHHVENGRADQLALIYDSPISGQKRQYTYRELRDEVAKAAGMIADQGVSKGDRVIIYMPMIPEAAIAMLACARLGAIHSVVFGGFAANELAVRIDDAEPALIISASCGIEISKIIEYKPLLDEAIELASHDTPKCIILQRPQAAAAITAGRDLDWHETMASAEAVDCTPVKAIDPLYILYTSGTTGKPKGVVRDNGGHAVAMNYSMHAVYDIKPGEVFWAASDVGWVVGHSYIVYAPLLRGCTTIFYEGKPILTPDAGAFWRVASEYSASALFAAPTAFRAIKKSDPDGEMIKDYDLSALKTIFMAGERLDPPTYEWTVEKTGKPVNDHWWQTETGWAIAGNMLGLEPMTVKPGSATVPAPGYNVKILDDYGTEMGPNGQGYIAVKLPLPPSCMPTIWNNHERFVDDYLERFPGYYVSGDGGYIDDDGYVFVMGRIDDVINIAGHRLSTGEMEEIVADHPAVAECAVFGINDALKGEVPLGMVLIKDGIDIDEETLNNELKAMVRKKIGAIACYNKTLIVTRLPKTRSGKILRRVLRQIAAGEEYTVPSTIDDPASLAELESVIKDHDIN
jgi:propionyl-CoA synthetase